MSDAVGVAHFVSILPTYPHFHHFPCYLLLLFVTLKTLFRANMKKSFILIGASLTSFFILSVSVYAQGSTAEDAKTGITTLASLVTTFTDTLVKSVGTLFLSAGVVAFFYGIVKYIWGSREGNAKAIEDGNKFMTWSLLALFVMFSVYGIIKFAQNVLGLREVNTITIPEVNFKRESTGTPTTNPTGGNPLGNAVCSGIANETFCNAVSGCTWNPGKGVCQ